MCGRVGALRPCAQGQVGVKAQLWPPGHHDARVPKETLWRQQNPDHPGCALPVHLHLHQDLGKAGTPPGRPPPAAGWGGRPGHHRLPQAGRRGTRAGAEGGRRRGGRRPRPLLPQLPGQHLRMPSHGHQPWGRAVVCLLGRRGYQLLIRLADGPVEPA